MRKFLSLLLALFTVFAALSPVALAGSAGGYTIRTAHEYRVRPGTDEWRSMTNAVERRQACYVPESKLRSMTTAALTETVLNYPLLIDIFAYNTLEDGIKAISNYFSGVKLLLERKDAAVYLSSYSARQSARTVDTDVRLYYADALLEYCFANNANTKTYGEDYYDPGPPIYTKKGRRVTPFVLDRITGKMTNNVYYRLIWEDHSSSLAKARVMSNHFTTVYNATLIGSPSPSYNCHSYAWQVPIPTQNWYWIDSPDDYIHDSERVYSASAGLKLTYTKGGQYAHSAVVISAASSVSRALCRSKWGYYGVFRHRADDCPFFTAEDKLKLWR